MGLKKGKEKAMNPQDVNGIANNLLGEVLSEATKKKCEQENLYAGVNKLSFLVDGLEILNDIKSLKDTAIAESILSEENSIKIWEVTKSIMYDMKVCLKGSGEDCLEKLNTIISKLCAIKDSLDMMISANDAKDEFVEYNV